MSTMLHRLLRTLDIAVIERLEHGAFQILRPAPAWLDRAFEEGAHGAQGTLGAALPFLDDFLPQAEATWRDHREPALRSGPFAAAVGGEDLLLRACALRLDDRMLLVLERLTGDADPRPLLQTARERLLDHERLARAASAVHAPVAALAPLLTRLGQTALDDDQRALMRQLQEAAERLQQAASALPAPPPTRRGTRG